MVHTRSGLHSEEQSAEKRLSKRPTKEEDEEEDDEQEQVKKSAKKLEGKANKQKSKKHPEPATSSGALSSSRVFLLVVIAAVLGYIAMTQNQTGGGNVRPVTEKDRQTIQKRREDRRKELQTLFSLTFAENELAVAKKIVADVLLRNERQVETGESARAITFHFGGGSVNESYTRMEHVIETFLFGSASSESTVHIAVHKGELDGVRNKIFDQLIARPRSLFIFERADDVPEKSLHMLEDAFEQNVFSHGGKTVDCTRAVFVLQTSLGQGMAEKVCGEAACTVEHKGALVKHLKQASQDQWTRQAFVARIREVVPFA